MASKKPEPTIDARVARGFLILKEIEDKKAELTKLEAELLALGAGRYIDAENRGCTAVAASLGGVSAATYELREGEDEKARKIAGDNFSELFEKKIVYVVKPGFVDRADALLTAAKKALIIALCLVPGKPYSGKKGYVKWD